MGRFSTPERTPPEFAATAGNQQRRTACLQRVQAVQREIGELCRTVGLSDAEEATVDAFERAVELARERCAAGERLAEEIQRQEAFCAEAERHAQTERAALEQASADERAAMARWLAWFQTHGVMRLCPARRRFSAPAWMRRMRLASALAKRRDRRRWRRIAAAAGCVRSLLSRPFTPGMMIYVPPRRRGTRWICVVRPIGCATSGDAWKSRFRP
ncbi:MAG: hypothetical protein ACLSTO_06655 [Bilophila wadsworthia]